MEAICKKVIEILKDKSLKISTMESCTAGSLVSALTNIEGSSAVVEGGYVTYSNEQKIRAGVSKGIINKFGVYSRECAKAMAVEAITNFKTDIGIGVTGSLGKIDPNNKDSIVGVIYYAIAIQDKNIFVYDIMLNPEQLQLSRMEQKQIVVNKILRSLHQYLTQ